MLHLRSPVTQSINLQKYQPKEYKAPPKAALDNLSEGDFVKIGYSDTEYIW